jgi:undecaprenyl-diphosphatase
MIRELASALTTVPVHADAALSRFVVRRRRDSWRDPARAVTALGETPVMVGLLLATGVRRPRTAVVDVGVLGLALAGRAALARRIRRGRPDPSMWWAEPTGFSMPSRHTFTAALGLGLLADRLPSRRLAGHRAARGLAAGVGASRVVLGLHWPSDVVVGYALGAAVRKLSSLARGHLVSPG